MLTGKTGFEPATSGVTNQHSNRLSYFPGKGEFIKPPHPELICSLFNESHFVFFPVVDMLYAQFIRVASQRLLERRIQKLPELMIKAGRLSVQVSLVNHNDIIEMLRKPIYIQTERK